MASHHSTTPWYLNCIFHNYVDKTDIYIFVFFLVQVAYDLGQKYYAPQVRRDRGSTHDM